jgi:hypothetical protein
MVAEDGGENMTFSPELSIGKLSDVPPQLRLTLVNGSEPVFYTYTLTIIPVLITISFLGSTDKEYCGVFA